MPEKRPWIALAAPKLVEDQAADCANRLTPTATVVKAASLPRCSALSTMYPARREVIVKGAANASVEMAPYSAELKLRSALTNKNGSLPALKSTR